jgi:hypothetical protein
VSDDPFLDDPFLDDLDLADSGALLASMRKDFGRARVKFLDAVRLCDRAMRKAWELERRATPNLEVEKPIPMKRPGVSAKAKARWANYTPERRAEIIAKMARARKRAREKAGL